MSESNQARLSNLIAWRMAGLTPTPLGNRSGGIHLIEKIPDRLNNRCIIIQQHREVIDPGNIQSTPFGYPFDDGICFIFGEDVPVAGIDQPLIRPDKDSDTWG